MDTYTLLGISLIKGIGKISLAELINLLKIAGINIDFDYPTVQSVFEDLNRMNKKIKIPTKDLFEDAQIKRETIRERSEKAGIRTISVFDKHFPVQLRNIPDAPLLLHYKGDIASVANKGVAVIGTRNPSEHGMLMGKKLADQLVDADFTVVGGLAIGCDVVGHTAAIEKRKPTIAVLAGGLNSITPKKNEPLAERIVDAGGLLLSEYPVDTPALKNFFIERDRLQSGISDGVLVIETGLKGGTRHTVQFAQLQGRLIGCLYTHELQNPNLSYLESFQGNREIVEKEGGIRLYDTESVDAFIKQLTHKYLDRTGS